MKRWFAMGALVAMPVFGGAECGWLLMIPPTTPVAVPSSDTAGAERWRQLLRPQLEADIRAPIAQWTQRRAFDSARACENELARVKDEQTTFLQSNSRQHLKAPIESAEAVRGLRVSIATLDNMERWNHARCLPSDKVPVK